MSTLDPMVILAPLEPRLMALKGVQMFTASCGHLCGIDPKSLFLVATEGRQSICLTCYKKRVSTGEMAPPDVEDMIPAGVLKSLKETLGEEATQGLLKRYQQWVMEQGESNEQ